MTKCGTNTTGSNEPELGVLDLLLRQDNFGSIDSDADGLEDDFGTEFLEQNEQPPAHEVGDENGTCYKDFTTEEERKEGKKQFDYKEEDREEGEEQEDTLVGCTDPAALNFNPDATQDDGSCIYEPVEDALPPLTGEYAFRSKADALALSKKKRSSLYYPTNKEEQQKLGKGNWADKLYYYNVPDNKDGSDGYMRWKPGYNKKNTKFWFPEPRPLNIALKYWRTGGFKNGDPIKSAQSATNGNYECSKDGMYTEGLCSSIKYLSVHITGISNETNPNRDPLGHAGGKFVKGEWSTPPYHWLFQKNGNVSQLLCDHRAGIAAGGKHYDTGETFHNHSVSVNWMTYGAGTDKYVDNGHCTIPQSARRNFNEVTFNKFRGHFPSDEQIIGMAKLIAVYIKRYPDIKVFGHNQQSTDRTCPVFFVPSWIRAGGIPGLDQEGIDKLILTGGSTKASSEAENDYSIAPKLIDSFGPDTWYGEAARQLAKISNPGGIGTGVVPRPSDFESNVPVNQNQPIVKKWQDMDCDEFMVYFNQNWKNLPPGVAGQRLRNMPEEERDEFEMKTYNCQG